MRVLANPLPPSLEYLHPTFGPREIAGMEGIALGVVLWWWSGKWAPALLLGLGINTATLILFWVALWQDWMFWGYDYAVVSLGELLVVLVEAGGMTWLLARRSGRDAGHFWWKALGWSLLLNALSYLGGAMVTTSPRPVLPG